MRLQHIEACYRSIIHLWLTAQVHVDAFRYAPFAYLTAVKWRILGKRVRARNQMAPLLGQSARAYRLWMARQSHLDNVNASPQSAPPIIALVDVSASAENAQAVKATLASLSLEGVTMLAVGADRSLEAVAAEIDWTAAPWLMPMMAGDRLSPGAASTYRTAIARQADQSTSIFYADDDQITSGGDRRTPHFKPDWNSELFRHFDYLTGACVVKAKRADLATVAQSPDWARRLVSRATANAPPVHVHQVLHHRTAHTQPNIITAPAASVHDLVPVSVIVPTRDRVDLLRTCLEGVAATDYPHIEVIVVDNGSEDPETLAYLGALDPDRATVLRHGGPFNYSAINNLAAARAGGKLLCLLNNDIEVITPDWLRMMATQALRDDVGAVGARLLYPDGRIQHAGVVIGVGGAAGHAHRFLHPDEQGYFRRHALPQFTSAVTAACLVVQRERFMAVGGLDERNFAVAFNDVDLCLRLNQRGWQSFYEPRATLIHHESVSRGLDRDPIGAARFAGELAALKRIWRTDAAYDPYHHPQLSRMAERFTLAI